MKSIKVKEETYSRLVAEAAYLSLKLGKRVSFNDTIEYLTQRQEATE